MSSSTPTIDPADVEPSGFMHSSKRRAGGLAQVIAASRAAKPATARSRISAGKAKKTRTQPLGPTSERLAKGDVVVARTIGGFCRAVAMPERLRDTRSALQLPKSRLTPVQVELLRDKGKLDHDPRTNEGMFQAAEKLRRHFEGCMIGNLKAQDLNKIIGSLGDDLSKEEAWVFHRDAFRTAVKLMGCSDTHPHRGAGRIVVSVVCLETSIFDAAQAHLPSARTEVMKATALDRLREGLYALACHWRFL